MESRRFRNDVGDQKSSHSPSSASECGSTQPLGTSFGTSLPPCTVSRPPAGSIAAVGPKQSLGMGVQRTSLLRHMSLSPQVCPLYLLALESSQPEQQVPSPASPS